MEEKSLFEILLDQEDTDNIVLLQEDGNEVEFEQIATVTLDGRYYTILHPVMEGIGEDDAVVFLLDDSDGDERLQVVEDEQLAMRAFDEYYRLLEE